MNRRTILFVDDEANILDGYKRALRKYFEIITAKSGAEGISIMKNSAEFAVIISDMRMPEMDGIEFLKRAKQIMPDSVRIMLTGNADQQTAIAAVNEGNIFRFLTKPCDPNTLAKVLEAGIEQYRLITAEKELLNETLNKSLQVMIEILSLVNPTAFSRASRIRKLAKDLAKDYLLPRPWEIEIAAMLSQIGCITVPEETLKKLSNAEPLNSREIKLYHQHPQLGHDLIAKIPRMNAIARMVANQSLGVNDTIDDTKELDEKKSIELGARILKIVTDFDRLLETGNSHRTSFERLVAEKEIYDSNLLKKLERIVEKVSQHFTSIEVYVENLRSGMLVDEPLYSNKNILLLTKGQEITNPLILSLKSLVRSGAISEKIKISVPEKDNEISKTDVIEKIYIPQNISRVSGYV